MHPKAAAAHGTGVDAEIPVGGRGARGGSRSAAVADDAVGLLDALQGHPRARRRLAVREEDRLRTAACRLALDVAPPRRVRRSQEPFAFLAVGMHAVYEWTAHPDVFGTKLVGFAFLLSSAS